MEKFGALSTTALLMQVLVCSDTFLVISRGVASNQNFPLYGAVLVEKYALEAIIILLSSYFTFMINF
jgi:hypothetical protein